MDRNALKTASPGLMVLDAVGTIVLGLGIAKRFAGVEVLPQPLRFGNDGLVLIAAGIVLSLPLLLRFMGTARAKKESLSGQGGNRRP